MANTKIAPEEIYDALLDDELFARLPARLARFLDARSVLMHWDYRDGSAEVLSHSGYFTDEQLQRYAVDFAQHDPWLIATNGKASNGLGENLERYVSDRDYEQSFFYNEFIRAIGDDTFRCIGLRSDTALGTGIIAVHRGKTQAKFSERELRAFDANSVHLRRMLDLRGRLAGSHREFSLLEQVLDSIPDAAIAVTSVGLVLHANAAGEALMSGGGAFRVRQGILGAADQREDRQLLKAVGAACEVNPIPSSILVRRENGSPIVVSVSPLRHGQSTFKALLLVHEATLKPEMLQNRLQTLFGLTPAESHIAVRLSEGARPSEISDERKASLGTIRIQIKSIYSKLDCSSQSQVTLLLRSIILPKCLAPPTI